MHDALFHVFITLEKDDSGGHDHLALYIVLLTVFHLPSPEIEEVAELAASVAAVITALITPRLHFSRPLVAALH